MAGRKQHYIQQHLLRGFAADPQRRPAQLWVYRKGAQPFMCSTENYGAQRDFYGPPEDTLVDDTITTAENKQFDQLIDAVRDCEDGTAVDAHASARFYQHLLFRSKNARDVFSVTTGQLMAQMGVEMLKKDKLLGFLVELYSRHPEQLVTKAEQQLGRPFSSVERAAVTDVLKNNLPVLVPRFLEEAWPFLEKMLVELVSRTPKMVAAGHQKALRENFANTDGKREMEMRQLQWHVYDVQECLVLGDSCVFAELATGRFVPLLSAMEEVANFYLPLSTSRYLVGNRTANKPAVTVEQLNQAAAACSYEAFCTSQNSERFLQLLSLIGQSVMPLSSDEIHRIAAESLSHVFIDQLAKGIV